MRILVVAFFPLLRESESLSAEASDYPGCGDSQALGDSLADAALHVQKHRTLEFTCCAAFSTCDFFFVSSSVVSGLFMLGGFLFTRPFYFCGKELWLERERLEWGPVLGSEVLSRLLQALVILRLRGWRCRRLWQWPSSVSPLIFCSHLLVLRG